MPARGILSQAVTEQSGSTLTVKCFYNSTSTIFSWQVNLDHNILKHIGTYSNLKFATSVTSFYSLPPMAHGCHNVCLPNFFFQHTLSCRKRSNSNVLLFKLHFKSKYLFCFLINLFIYLLIFGCAGSSLLRAGFL